jgi:peptidoglycan/xylan/chitin deacetylase (PgdA/CDA1 family)
MRLDMLRATFCGALVLAGLAHGSSASSRQRVARRVVVTIDDLPMVSRNFRSPADRERITRNLVAALRANDVPAIGFVNEGKIHRDTVLDSAGVELLRQWTRAGLELGNHSYSHIDLHTTPVDAYLADVARGDVVTRRLMAEAARQPRYFRHPYLHSGRSLADRGRVDSMLAARSYRVAPVTIDNGDYIFAAAYDDALGRRDSTEARRIGDEYVAYMERVFAYYERQTTAIVGRDMPHVLLIHANVLNADRFGELARMMRARGYAFVRLEDALADSVYRSADTYVGAGGISWLHRWAITRGMPGATFAGEPEVPADIRAVVERR